MAVVDGVAAMPTVNVLTPCQGCGRSPASFIRIPTEFAHDRCLVCDHGKLVLRSNRKADVPEADGTVIPRDVLELALERMAAHPAGLVGGYGGGPGPLQIINTSHVVRKVWVEPDGAVAAKIDLLRTPRAARLIELLYGRYRPVLILRGNFEARGGEVHDLTLDRLDIDVQPIQTTPEPTDG